MTSARRRSLVFAALAVGSLLGGLFGKSVAGAPRAVGASTSLLVPMAVMAPRVDGELDDQAWSAAARTGSFTRGGAPSRPYSDARFLWRDGMLFVALYAGDEDIRFGEAKHDDPLWMGDSFAIVLVDEHGVERTIDVSAGGVLTDGTRKDGRSDPAWESHARVAVDRDGTPNDPSDQDEEWIVEMAIPLASLGLRSADGERIAIHLERCDSVAIPGEDRPRRVCASWPERGGAQLILTDATHDR